VRMRATGRCGACDDRRSRRASSLRASYWDNPIAASCSPHCSRRRGQSRNRDEQGTRVDAFRINGNASRLAGSRGRYETIERARPGERLAPAGNGRAGFWVFFCAGVSGLKRAPPVADTPTARAGAGEAVVGELSTPTVNLGSSARQWSYIRSRVGLLIKRRSPSCATIGGSRAGAPKVSAASFQAGFAPRLGTARRLRDVTSSRQDG